MTEAGRHGPLLLVAASGLAREVAESAAAAGREVVGLLDDDPAKQETSVSRWSVVGTVDDVVDFPDAAVVVCVGRGAGREQVVARLERLGVGVERYATVVDPSVRISPSVSVGVGSVLLAGVALTADVVVGRHVVVMPHVTLTHDDTLEDFATLAAGVALGGSVRVGRGAYLGMSSSVRERCAVGPGATVGMGAVVLEDVPAGTTVIGVPARPYEPARSAHDGG